MKILQVALDLTDLDKALDTAVKLSTRLDKERVWIEAGTPLIKSWGRIGVKLLKDLTGFFIVADTKTMDTGGLEAELFYKAGADAVTVLGLADDSTIIEAVDKKREHGKALIVDLINHPNPLKRAIEVDKLGVDVILYHVGVDVQVKRGITASALINELMEIRKKVSSKIAVAGGIKQGEAKRFIDVGVDVVVVGSAIVRSGDPVKSAELFLNEIYG